MIESIILLYAMICSVILLLISLNLCIRVFSKTSEDKARKRRSKFKIIK